MWLYLLITNAHYLLLVITIKRASKIWLKEYNIIGTKPPFPEACQYVLAGSQILLVTRI